MVHHTRLIILNTTKIGERSLVLHALSPDWGRRSFVAAVPKGGVMALFQPLSVLDAEVVEYRVDFINEGKSRAGQMVDSGSQVFFLAGAVYDQLAFLFCGGNKILRSAYDVLGKHGSAAQQHCQ